MCTLTLHGELGLRAVVERLAAVAAAVGDGQLVDGQAVRAPLPFQAVLGPRVQQHPLPHPLHLPRVQAHFHLQRRLAKLFGGEGRHALGEEHLLLWWTHKTKNERTAVQPRSIISDSQSTPLTVYYTDTAPLHLA